MEKVQQFHAWLQKINNVYLTDDNRLSLAFDIILKQDQKEKKLNTNRDLFLAYLDHELRN